MRKPLPLMKVNPLFKAVSVLARFGGEYLLLIACIFCLCVLLMAISPLDPLVHTLGIAQYARLSETKKQALQEYWLLGLPFADIARIKIEALAQGNWGSSKIFSQDVISLITERLPYSLCLVLPAWLLSGIIGIFLGIMSAYKPQSLLSKALVQCSFLLSSIPLFSLGLISLFVFAVYIPLFPLGFTGPVGESMASITIGARIHHMVLPCSVLILGSIPQVFMHTRMRALEVMKAPFMSFAQKNGMTSYEALVKHGLKHMLVPGISILLAQVGFLIGETIVVEEVFSYQGLGKALVDAALKSDFDLLFALSVLAASLVFVAGKAQLLVWYAESPQEQRRMRSLLARLNIVPRTAVARAYMFDRIVAQGSLCARIRECIESRARMHAFSSRLQGMRAHIRKRGKSCQGMRTLGLQARRPWLARCALLLVVMLFLAALIASFFFDAAAEQVRFSLKNLPPSAEHLFGTDVLGRDLFARCMVGLRISSFLAFGATVLALGCAAVFALVQAYLPRSLIARVCSLVQDVFLSLPQLVLLILFSLIFGRGIIGLVAALSLSHWPSVSRVLTSELSQVTKSCYVARAQRAGVHPLRIVKTHYLPALIPQLSAGTAILFPHVLLHEASLSFLGLGLSLETPSLGIIAHESLKTLAAGYWWEWLFPSLSILFALVAVYSSIQLYRYYKDVRT